MSTPKKEPNYTPLAEKKPVFKKVSHHSVFDKSGFMLFKDSKGGVYAGFLVLLNVDYEGGVKGDIVGHTWDDIRIVDVAGWMALPK